MPPNAYQAYLKIMCLMVSIFKDYVVKPPHRESHSFEIGICFINQSVNQVLNTPVRVDAFTAHLASHWIDRWQNKIYEIKIMYIKPKWLVIWGLIEKKTHCTIHQISQLWYGVFGSQAKVTSKSFIYIIKQLSLYRIYWLSIVPLGPTSTSVYHSPGSCSSTYDA